MSTHWKKKEYAALKNVGFGEWEPIKENLVLIPVAIPSIILEIAMLYTDIITAKKSVEKKRQL